VARNSQLISILLGVVAIGLVAWATGLILRGPSTLAGGTDEPDPAATANMLAVGGDESGTIDIGAPEWENYPPSPDTRSFVAGGGTDRVTFEGTENRGMIVTQVVYQGDNYFPDREDCRVELTPPPGEGDVDDHLVEVTCREITNVTGDATISITGAFAVEYPTRPSR